MKFNFTTGRKRRPRCTQSLPCGRSVKMYEKIIWCSSLTTRSTTCHLLRNATKSCTIIMWKKVSYLITHDIEYNDGCASQFKCIRALSSLARRAVKTSGIFCETSHGKSKSDGLGGVVNSFVTRAVCGERRLIRDAKELTDFFDEMLVVKSAFESHRPMLNRLFFYVSSDDMELQECLPIAEVCVHPWDFINSSNRDYSRE